VTRHTESQKRLLEIFNIKEEEFGWCEGWYAEWEREVVWSILKFNLNLVTPIEVCV
jgi:hypothetical protein